MVNNNLLTETDSLSLNIKSAHSNLKIKHFNTLVEMLYFYLKRSNFQIRSVLFFCPPPVAVTNLLYKNNGAFLFSAVSVLPAAPNGNRLQLKY